MNKREIAARMARDAGITLLQAEKAFTSMVKAIKNALRKGQRVTLSGLGSIEVKQRKARKGRNPKTGEVISIPEKKRVKFNPSKSFQDSFKI